MAFFSKDDSCKRCYSGIDHKVYGYSLDKFEIPLCIPCQDWYKETNKTSTHQTILLYLALKKRKVPAELEKFDGHKRIDIAITKAKVNIEVDGKHHNYDPKQALSDLERTLFSFKKGYLTLRIPNALVESLLEQTTNYIYRFLNESIEQLKH